MIQSKSESGMSTGKYAHDGDAIPRVLLIAGAGMIVLTLLATAVARLTEVGTLRVAPVTYVESKDLALEKLVDGTVLLREVARPGIVHVVPPTGNDGFVRVALQSLMRDRDMAGIAASDKPFRLMRQDGGRLWLEDLATNRRLTLEAFGSGNAKVFEKFLTSRSAAP
jgi:putative photosynthetic complex assembly protein